MACTKIKRNDENSVSKLNFIAFFFQVKKGFSQKGTPDKRMPTPCSLITASSNRTGSPFEQAAKAEWMGSRQGHLVLLYPEGHPCILWDVHCILKGIHGSSHHVAGCPVTLFYHCAKESLHGPINKLRALPASASLLLESQGYTKVLACFRPSSLVNRAGESGAICPYCNCNK